MHFFHIFVSVVCSTCTQVISAANLAKTDIFGGSDPYVRIDLVTISREKVLMSLFSFYQNQVNLGSDLYVWMHSAHCTLLRLD